MSSNDSIRLVLPGFASAATSDTHRKTTKKILKISLKVLKILIYLTFFGIGLYGCFQTYTDYWTTSSTLVGQGMEIGFSPNSGIFDPSYTLIYSGTGGYFPMSTEFTMAYGPFYAIFVWPFAMILLYFMYATRSWPVGLNALVGIFLILLIIRLITLAVSARSMLQAEKMTEVQGKIAEINAKYKDAKDIQSRQKKQLEIQAIYKKHNISPFASMEQIFITLPIFLIIYRVVSILRPLKFAIIFNAWDLTKSPITELLNSFTTTGWPYIFFLILVIPAQFFSQMMPRYLAKKRSRGASTVGVKNNDAMKKTNTINLVMSIFMSVITITVASGIGLYWFFSALFSMAQSAIIHKLIMNKKAKGITIQSKLSKFGID